jgi:hypothetical protein
LVERYFLWKTYFVTIITAKASINNNILMSEESK